VNRREVVAGLAGATAWPISARAQQSMTPVVGFLSSASAAPFAHLIAAFRDGLQEAGFVEQQNVAVEYRWADGRYDELPALAAELVRRQVSVIVTSGGDNVVFAAKAETATIPIVFVVGSDPVKIGLVAGHARPGGNVTGVNMVTIELVARRVGLLLEVAPAGLPIAVLVNPNFAPAATNAREAEAAARALGRQVTVFDATTADEINSAFVTMVQAPLGGLVVTADPFFNSRREQIVTLAGRNAVPAIYEWREFAELGGLMSYGTILPEAYRQEGIYAGRILKGEKPADLPVVQLSRFELVINLKTAKALGATIPPSLLARADEVIE